MLHLSRIYHLVLKEILLLLKDPQVRFMMIGPPIIQLLIFSYAATLELNHVKIAIVNHDTASLSNELTTSLAASPFVQEILYTQSQNLPDLLDSQQVLAAIIIDESFSQNLLTQTSSSVQVLLDGRKANPSQLFLKYFQQILDQTFPQPLQPQILTRYWYNENLIAIWTTVPALVVIIAMLMGLLITGLSISREREMGTLDALLVSPIHDYEIIIAKALPAIGIGLFQSLLMTLFGVLLLQVPLRGSIFTLLILCLCFVYSIVGLGLCLSAFAKNQQQAIIGVFLLMVPSVTLSGYAAPIENMPHWMQALSQVNPLKYALLGSKSVFLKNASLISLLPTCFLLILMGSIFLSLALVLFRYKRRTL
jgi:ABC-2 type transport system permease protein